MGVILLNRSITGTSHNRSETPCQDSWKTVSLDDGTVILAVADGHGSKNCPYSKGGARIAVNVFCDILQDLYEGYADNPDQLPSYLNREGDTQIAMAIDAEWKKRVVESYKRNPENEKMGDSEDELSFIYKQYGTTLLGLMITENYYFGFQLGDGDICYVNENGLEMVIEPDKILGVETHSLSRKKSWEKAITVFRRFSARENLPAMFSLSSDGFANSYKSEEDFRATIREYLEMLKEYGVTAVQKSLPSWLKETSEMGCGDDITMVIAYYPDDQSPAQAKESEETTDE